jgi:hypothetical protein
MLKYSRCREWYYVKKKYTLTEKLSKLIVSNYINLQYTPFHITGETIIVMTMNPYRIIKCFYIFKP